jgi:retron-type reverse transcriptase
LDEEVSTDVIIIDFSKAFNLVPHDRLRTKLVASGVDARVVVWVRNFLVGRTQRVKSRRGTIQEVKVTLGVPQGSVLGPLRCVVVLNYIYRSIDSSIRLFADDCIIYRKITNKNDTEMLHKGLDTLGKWEVKNRIKINHG